MNLKAFLRIADRARTFAAAGGRVFAVIPARNLGCQTLAVRSQAFRHWFFDQCYIQYETLPSAPTFAAILHHLEGKAAREPETCNIRVPFRVDSRGPAFSPDQVYLDLANLDGQFVKITRDGWDVASGPGFPFETSPATAESPLPETLPDPQSDTRDTLRLLRESLNLGPAEGPDWLRCLAWLLSALRSTGPFPILILRGPTGCGKSFAARTLRTLVDPSHSPFAPSPTSARDLLAFARQNWVLAFDHVGHLTPKIVATLCRLSTGAGVACREPGSPEPLQLWLKRPILLTVDENWVPPPDLAGRALIVTLPALPPGSHRPEPEIAAGLQEVYPRILGVLCSAVSRALAADPPSAASACSSTRHAGALAWAQAAAGALDSTALQMQAAFDFPAPPNPLINKVQALLQPDLRWVGTAAELVQVLPISPSPRSLSAKLREFLLPLADTGIDLHFYRRSRNSRLIDLQLVPDFAPQIPEDPQQHAEIQALTVQDPMPSVLNLCVTTRPPSPPPLGTPPASQ